MPYDIHVQPVPADQVVGYYAFSFGFTAALKVQGLQSLVNRWVRTFMTPKGSDLMDSNAGSEFAALIGNNIPSASTELVDILSFSLDDVNDQVRQQDLEGEYSSDEQLGVAELIRFNIPSPDAVEMWISISNLDEDSLVVRLADLTTR